MSRVSLPEPPDDLKRLSETLSAIIREEIRERGQIPFSRFMELALYQPGLGYYSAGLHKLGAGGDFVTAPELGSLFAACLARQIEQLAQRLGDYDILEIGAGSGHLAADILRSLPAGLLPRRYMILDRSADLRQVQGEHLKSMPPELAQRVLWLDRPPDEPWRGMLLANEVIDALTVECFRIKGSAIEQMCVAETEHGFKWMSRPARGELADALATLGVDFPAAYRSEINLQLAPWLKAMTSSLQQGLALFIDYGYPRREYYLDQRKEGTLICHYQHRAHDDVFFWPGLQDITAFVDFTLLAEASDSCGMQVEGYTSQAMFLLGCGLDQVLTTQTAQSTDGGMALNAQARQLTLPGMMGERFQVMGLSRELELDAIGFSLLDLRHRL
jgi:SAM-dependent MidA family methyltransferase